MMCYNDHAIRKGNSPERLTTAPEGWYNSFTTTAKGLEIWRLTRTPISKSLAV